jgi:predicted metal-dependent peptidase
MPISKKDQDFLIAAMRVKAARLRPYYSKALFAAEAYPVDTEDTFSIDKSFRIHYNPKLLTELTIEEGAAVFIHEINHVLREHFHRAELKGSKHNGLLTNLAQDLEINDDLLDEGLRLPSWVFSPKKLDLPNDLLWEQYYDLLLDKKITPCSSKGCSHSDGTQHVYVRSCGSGAHGNAEAHDEAPGLPPGLSTVEQNIIKQAIAEEILNLAKNRGHVPNGLLRWAKEYINPKVPWFKELRASLRKGIMDAAGMVDFSYTRLSRRQSVVKDFVLPGFRSPSLSVGVIVDTSGSMSADDLGRALAEIKGILKATGTHKQTTVISVDAAVHSVNKVFKVDQIKIMGGGGTDMCRGFEFFDNQKKKPDVVVLLTDGETPFPEKPTVYKSICVLIGNNLSRVKSAVPTWMKTIAVED